MPSVLPNERFLFVACYTQGNGNGLLRFRFDYSTGQIEAAGSFEAGMNPSFFVFDESRARLYVVNRGRNTSAEGIISSFAVNPEEGELTLIDRVPSGGAGPCYVGIDRRGCHVLASNYLEGTVTIVPVAEDGRFIGSGQTILHHGRGPHVSRQQAPHPHSIHADPSNRFVLVPDLGTDRVVIYRLDEEQGRLLENEAGSCAVAPGAGPRHLCFAPEGTMFFLLNELDSTASSISLDPDTGSCRVLATASTLPEGFSEESIAADVHLAPNGLLYASNRGHNSIVVFAVDAASGRLKQIGHVSTRGKTPRNFLIDSTGRWMLVANQDSDSLVVLRIDGETGMPELNSIWEGIRSPVCMGFIPAP